MHTDYTPLLNALWNHSGSGWFLAALFMWVYVEFGLAWYRMTVKRRPHLRDMPLAGFYVIMIGPLVGGVSLLMIAAASVAIVVILLAMTAVVTVYAMKVIVTRLVVQLIAKIMNK